VTEIVGIHHLGLTVSDVERSARWYQDVLGFERVGELGDAGAERQKIFLRHAGLDARLGLVAHRSSSRRPFDETESGLDHLAFAVSSREELERWARRLEELGVRFSPIADSLSIPGAAVIVFRDPDNVQLELFSG
jgi:glyoxylase I family protein